ncbi:hypothetical protein BST83_18665 [Polaribacter filamentus]|jgi:hypothetical protein|uniref:Uncharacterized protein n=1 Tax=Polaribacter filamentus TaxID=53483 RepID=A0A2S7KL21_9FLAO|nr:hypothetical protein [Polaribacter filamentus]PQB03324.1 hypothetical protein BST83_18665 [Polaribacter filamentus]
MIKKIAITFSVILYAVVVPFLDVSETHVWNPDWTPHALIHEVWQLITNSSIGVVCLWLVWYKKDVRLSTLLSLIVMGGFLLAFFLKDGYGGSMKYLDGSEKTVLGINIGILGFGIAFLFLILSHVFTKTKKSTNNSI